MSESDADAIIEDIWNNLKTGFLETTEEVCGTTRPTVGAEKPGGGMRKLMWPLQLSVKLSRHGRLVKAQVQHTMQPSALLDM